MLNKYSELTRSNLNKMQRLKVTAIVTIEVHQRDITEKLIKQGCSDENAFEWLSQLRFYMERVCSSQSIISKEVKYLFVSKYLKYQSIMFVKWFLAMLNIFVKIK